MPFWFPPPPPVVSRTGAQPYAGNKLPPSVLAVAVNPPPPVSEGRYPNATPDVIVRAWQPDPWSYSFVGGQQPYDGHNLPPSVLAALVNPPAGILTDVVVIPSGRSLPQTTKFLPQGTVAATSVPYFPLDWLPAVLGAWQLPDPAPTQQRKLSPGIPGQSADFPPFINEWLDQAQGQIVLSWQPPDPLPQQPGKLSPAIPGQSVDNPPPASEGRYPNATPDVIVRSWQPPDPPPTLPGKLSPGIPGQSVDNPPGLRPQQQPYLPLETSYPQVQVKQVQPFVAASVQQAFTSVWLNPVLTSWQPVDPPPTLAKYLNPQITAVPVNNPPFTQVDPFPNILVSWQPPDPQPTLPTIKLLQAFIPAAPGDPPAGILTDIYVYQSNRSLPQTTRFLPQPFTPAVTTQVPFQLYSVNTILASWRPVDPPPTLPKQLNPQITAVSVDNPPFGLLVTVIEPWLSEVPFQPLRYKLVFGVPVNNPPFTQVDPLPSILASWQPPDPQPQQPAYKVVTGVPVNNPPFTSMGRDGLTAAIIQSWQPPDPPPVQKGPLPPQLTAVPVNNPPGVNPDNTPTYWAIMGVWDIPLPPQPQQTKYIVTIIPPPIPSKELHDHPWFATFGKMTVH